MTRKLLVNENFPAPALRTLGADGIDVMAVAEAMRGESDEAVIAAVHAQGRSLVTFDRDYRELVFKGGLACPPAIVLLGQRPYPPDHAARLVLDLLAGTDEVTGFFVVAGAGSVRRRPLPLPAR